MELKERIDSVTQGDAHILNLFRDFDRQFAEAENKEEFCEATLEKLTATEKTLDCSLQGYNTSSLESIFGTTKVLERDVVGTQQQVDRINEDLTAVGGELAYVEELKVMVSLVRNLEDAVEAIGRRMGDK